MPQRTIVIWAATASLAGFLFGFDTAVISGAERAVQRIWAMSPTLHGLAISSALWGTVIGALFGAVPSDRYGRKPTLFAIGLIYLVSAVGTALAWNPASFILFRFLGGLAVGASSIAAPTYIAEIAPPAWRGRLGALFQTMIVLGILVAYLSNLLLAGQHPDDWRLMLGMVAVPSVLFLVAVAFVSESPRWLLLHRGNRAEAETILRLSGSDVASLEADDGTASERKMSLSRFFDGHLKRPIRLAFLIAFFNQLSGINAIIYYAPRIFDLAGLADKASLLATVGVGTINLIFTLLGLALIDKSGRRALMLIGSIGYIVSLSLVAFGFGTDRPHLVLPFIFLFIGAHAIGQGAVIWVYISEIFPNAARASGQALGTATHWILAAIITLATPPLLAAVPPATIFGIFAGATVLQLLFVLTMMVETRGRSLEDIARELNTKAVRPRQA